MRSSTKFLCYGLPAVLLAVTVPRVVMSYLRRLTSALLMLCVLSTSALASGSGMFGPVQNPPRATAVLLSPDEARQIAATLSDCETAAVELETTRAELQVTREALELTRRSALAFEAASKANAERADNEAQRALNESLLRAGVEAELKRERRKGRWRAIRWGLIGAGIGAVLVAAGGE